MLSQSLPGATSSLSSLLTLFVLHVNGLLCASSRTYWPTALEVTSSEVPDRLRPVFFNPSSKFLEESM